MAQTEIQRLQAKYEEAEALIKKAAELIAPVADKMKRKVEGASYRWAYSDTGQAYHQAERTIHGRLELLNSIVDNPPAWAGFGGNE